MVNIFKKIKIRVKRNKNKPIQESKSKLYDELRKVCLELEKTNLWFQNEIDGNLIDACIHQRKVLNAKYKYLINKIRLSRS